MLKMTRWTSGKGAAELVEVDVRTPCECGCDNRDGRISGYVIARFENGTGATLRLPDTTDGRKVLHLLAKINGKGEVK